MRVAIIGGGLIGCATALTLAERGADVVVFDRGVPGAEASRAAAGILGAQVELGGRSEDIALFVRARELWKIWAPALSEASGIDVGYRISGVLRVALSELESAQVRSEVQWQVQQGLRASLLEGGEARRIEPELAPRVMAAAYFPDDAQVDPPALLRALVGALTRRRRAEVRSGATVERLLLEGDRCAGVKVDGEDSRADATVLAAGSWSSLLPGVPLALPPVRPVRGQIVLLDESPPRVRSIVFGSSGYVVPRGDGRVLCGSTMERVGFRNEVTAAGVHAILEQALTCVPSLGGARLAQLWNNFRPHVDGSHPLVGSSLLPGLFLATGHFRNGVLLAKVTADAVASAILGS